MVLLSLAAYSHALLFFSHTGFGNGNGNPKDSGMVENPTPEVKLPCERCAEHELHIKQLQERMAVMEDIHNKEMDSIAARLQTENEERQKREEECERLKRERDDLLGRLEEHQPRITTEASRPSSVMMSLKTIIAGIITI